MRKKTVVCFLGLMIIVCGGCYRKDIQFGTVPENNYSSIVYVDTVEPRLSTIVFDSFATNSATTFLIGKYKDPYLGIISVKPFFQMTVPPTVPDIPSTAQYDSAGIIIYPNKYYYGDTTRSITISANELALPLYYTYSTNIYNTSYVPVKPTLLGSRTLKIRPAVDDSFIIRMNDTKGQELFTKLRQRAGEVTSNDSFQNYFDGISFSVGNNDTSVVYGLTGTAGKVIMRIYYHLTTPFYQSNSIDFPSMANNFAFNQIITDRSNTTLYSSTTGIKEFPSEQTNDLGFTQYGAGVLLKVTFPTLKGIQQSENIVKLLRAELILKPLGQTYNGFLKLPPSLTLAQTDATNIIGNQVFDSTGTTPLSVAPIIDNIYGINTYYRFNLTSYINSFLTTTGTEQNGFFLMESNSTTQIDRAVIGNIHNTFKTQLLLTLAVINK